MPAIVVVVGVVVVVVGVVVVVLSKDRNVGFIVPTLGFVRHSFPALVAFTSSVCIVVVVFIVTNERRQP
jgi:hypothetical protein